MEKKVATAGRTAEDRDAPALQPRRVALVTGATSGIGKATAAALAKQGYHVVITARNAAKGEAVRQEIGAAEVLLVDLSSQISIRQAASSFLAKHGQLHVLVNCAGVFRKERHETADGLEETFATNYLAYFLLTNLLVPALKAGARAASADAAGSSANTPAAPSRVVNVSSKYGNTRIDFDDLQTAKGKYSYFRSTPKTMLARVLFTQEMAERLKGSGVTVNTLHPGLVKDTQLLSDTGGFFRWLTNALGKPAAVGADTVVWLATAPEAAGVTGKMFEKRKEIKTPGQGSDAAARKRLWDESAKLTKLA
jgi:NAD(P)-dependent dehydrogenase (short-subunit alcohol dehydrogenase family)